MYHVLCTVNVRKQLRKIALKQTALKRSKEKATQLLQRLGNDCMVRNSQHAFQRWKKNIQQIIQQEIHQAAIKIQNLFRQRK
jgi:mRNA-degrading endonuclease RelE of RelBE toxin-antitoxin system